MTNSTIDVSTDSGITLTTSTYTSPVTITAGTTIANASGDGVSAASDTGVWALTNDGVIAANGSGVSLAAGGSVTNDASASITGLTGVYITGGSGTVVNAGSIYGTGDNGVVLLAGGSVSNTSTGTIGNYGVYIGGGAASVINNGNIAGGAGLGVNFGSAGSVTNTGTITGAVGVQLAAGGTLTNAGAITGTDGTAVYLGGTDVNLLVVDAGAVFNGAVVGGTGAFNTLELAAGGAGTLSGLGTEYAGFNGVTVDAGATWELAGANTLEATATLTNNGALTDTGSLTNDGLIQGGITLGSGGMLTNAAGATITNTGNAAVYGIGGPGTLTNDGVITGNGSGVSLAAGGSVTNDASASITGLTGVYITGGSGTVVNAGSIYGTGDNGVVLLAGGSVSNTSTGTIGSYGVYIGGGAASVINNGNIAGGSGYGVNLGSTGSVTNTGTITGALGVQLEAGGTLTNAGAITGTDGTAVYLGGTGSNLLVLDAGAVFNGTVEGGTGASNTLELAAGGVGTLSGLGTEFTGFNGVTVDTGATWDLSGANTLEATATLTNNGTLVLSAATLTDAGGAVNNGQILLDGSTMSVAAITGTGSTTIDGSSTLTVQGTVSSGETIVFANAGGVLDLAAPADVTGTISGFGAGDSIDLTNLGSIAGDQVNLLAGNILAVSEAGGGTIDLQLAAADNFEGLFFHLIQDGNGADITVDGTPCYCRGTRILTEQGEVAVEDLAIGDRLVTVSGAAKPLRWIGRRSYNGQFAAGNRNVLPVLIRKGALADGVPHRDLWVSPLHAMFLNGALIPASALVNGTSIVQAASIESVEYFHLELAAHDVIYAEGASSETFVDDGSRGMFHNAADYSARYPDAPAALPVYCAPRVEDGFALEAVRRQIEARAGLRDDPATLCFGPLRGYVDRVGRGLISGWAQTIDNPEAPVELQILDRGVVIGRVLANRYRADLEQAGFGSGRHGFEFRIPGGLSPSASHAVDVRRAADGQYLQGSSCSAATSILMNGGASV